MGAGLNGIIFDDLEWVTWQFLDRQFLDRHSNPNPNPKGLFLTQSRNWRDTHWVTPNPGFKVTVYLQVE